MDDLVTWFREHDGFLDAESMALTKFPDCSRGAIAVRDIPQGHTLFSIPRILTLSTRTSSLPGLVGEKAWKRHKLDQGWAGLILCMMWEEAQGSNSKWAKYLNSLPTNFDTPMFWTSEDIEELRGTAVVGKIGKEDAERDYNEKIVPALQSREDLFSRELLPTCYSLERYHIMGSRILSRSFQVEKWDGEVESGDDDHEKNPAHNNMDVDIPAHNHDAGEPNGGAQVENEDDKKSESDEEDEDPGDPSDVAMVPMADMLNARYGLENAKLFHEEKELKMTTTKAIKVGEQIWNTYGDLPNSDLLRRYGHVDLIPLTDGGEGNPVDVVEVPADMLVASLTRHSPAAVASRDGDLKERIDWWLEEGGDDVFVLEAVCVVPDAFVSLARLLLLSPEDWQTARDKDKPPRPKLDAQVVPIITSVLEARLAQYTSSIEADKILLEEAKSGRLPLSLNRRHALIVRLGEKKLLHGALNSMRAVSDAAKAKSAVNGGGKGKDNEKRKRKSDGHDSQVKDGTGKRSKR